MVAFGTLKEYGDFGIGTFEGLDGEMIGFDGDFYQLKADGIAYPVSDSMKTRSVPRQEKPYPPLVEVTKNQSIFEFDDVEGTIVGFRCPSYVAGVNVPGYHLHFLTKSKDAGGHVLEFNVEEAAASMDYASEFLMILPSKDSDFYDIDLTQDKQEELEKAEK